MGKEKELVGVLQCSGVIVGWVRRKRPCATFHR